MSRQRILRLSAMVALPLIGLLALAPDAVAAPTISVAGQSPFLAGQQVAVLGSGFVPSMPVIFFWDGNPSSDSQVADGSGNLPGSAVTIPVSLAPGTHTLGACTEATQTTCSGAQATTPVLLGPTVSTTAPSPVHRGASVSITVGGEPAMTTAIYGWNGSLGGGSISVPDMPTFTITTTVPSNAPAHSTFQVCEGSGGSCVPGTSGTLSFTVFVPVVTPTPTPTHTTTTPSRTATPSTSAASSSASASPSPSQSPSPSPSPAPTPTPSPTPTSSPKPVIVPSPTPIAPQPTASRATPLYTPKAVVHLEVAALALIATLGVGAMGRGIEGLVVPAAEVNAAAAGAVGGAAAAGASKRGGSASSAKVKAFKGGREATEAGDRSFSWRSPGTAALDSVAFAGPTRVARSSPLLARVLIDASYLRAAFGSLAMLLPLGGIVLGVLAAKNTGGLVLPPSFGLLTALAVLGVFDAFAGFLAAATFLACTVFTGDLATEHGIRTMLGLGVIWFAAPLIAAATRPLRRDPPATTADRRRRIADLVLAALISAWAIQKMIGGLPGLAGRPLAITHDAKRVALIVLIAIAVRVCCEAAAARWYPLRLGEVQPRSVPKPGNRQRILMSLVRTAVFLFFAVAFLGWHWQLWAGAAVLFSSQLLSIYEDRFHNSPRLYRWLPRGLTKLVIMLFVGAWIGALVLSSLANDKHAAADAFVLLVLPGLAITVVELYGRAGEEPEETGLRWLAGCGVLVVGLAFVFGYLN